MDKVTKEYQLLKFDEEHGIVFGFCLVCHKNGAPYVDSQDEYVTEPAMMKAAIDFAESQRVAAEAHKSDDAGEVRKVEVRGEVLFNFPLTSDIAKALDIETAQTGWLIGMRPDPDMLEGFRSGRLRGFSIGGWGSGMAGGLDGMRSGR